MPENNRSTLTRRDFAKLTLAGVPASLLLSRLPLSAAAKINSRINGVLIGAITYSFRSMTDAEDIIKAYVEIGLGEMELMSNHGAASSVSGCLERDREQTARRRALRGVGSLEEMFSRARLEAARRQR